MIELSKIKVFVIGSCSQIDEINKVASIFSNLGIEIDTPEVGTGHFFEYMVKRAISKIKEADFIIAVPKKDGTFGDGSTYEMLFAEDIGKPIFIYGNSFIDYWVDRSKPSDTVPEINRIDRPSIIGCLST